MPIGSCTHNPQYLRQTNRNSFACTDCGMGFFGIDIGNREFRRLEQEAMRLAGLMPLDLFIYPEQHMRPGLTHTNVHVDLGTIPQDILDTKNQLKEMEKALSMFAEVLKSVIQR